MTYREDVYRMLTSLIDKGMVNPSLNSPTVYAAVDIKIALAYALPFVSKYGDHGNIKKASQRGVRRYGA